MDRERLQSVTVTAAATVRDAMSAIQAGGVETCLVVSDDRRLVGIVTDGDVRRALLTGHTLDESVSGCINTHFQVVGSEVGRAEALDLMLARGFSQLPIVDPQGRLVGLHLLRDFIGPQARPNHAVIMAGGEGTRLRPITERMPKPMVPVAGRPILERLVLHLLSHGIRHMHLAINYMGDVIEQHFGDGHRFGCQIDYIREPVPMGSGGAITLLDPPPEAPLLVLNGDLVTQVNIARLLEAHEASGAPVTVGVSEHPVTIPFGVIEADERGRLVGQREKPTHLFLVNAGIYVISPECWSGLARGTAMTMPDVLAVCLEAGTPPAVYRLEEDWVDVGRHVDLQRARGEVPS